MNSPFKWIHFFFGPFVSGFNFGKFSTQNALHKFQLFLNEIDACAIKREIGRKQVKMICIIIKSKIVCFFFLSLSPSIIEMECKIYARNQIFQSVQNDQFVGGKQCFVQQFLGGMFKFPIKSWKLLNPYKCQTQNGSEISVSFRPAFHNSVTYVDRKSSLYVIKCKFYRDNGNDK